MKALVVTLGLLAIVALHVVAGAFAAYGLYLIAWALTRIF